MYDVHVKGELEPYDVQLSTVSASRVTGKINARPVLTREFVLDHAVTLADAEGLDAVTVRRLAGLLGVTPMALYWHFRTKNELLEALGDRVLDAVRVPVRSEDWDGDFRAALLALVTAMRPHPQLVALVPDRLLEHPAGLALSEMVLACLAAAGFSAAPAGYLATQALRMAITMVTEDLIDDGGDRADERDARRRRLQGALASLPPHEYPALVSHAEAIAHCTSTDEHVELAVDLFIAGVRAFAAGGR